MEFDSFMRVVSLRRGKLRASEFQLRPGEVGLSLFAVTQQPNPSEVIEAVRSAGKQGELAAAVLHARDIQKLGLVLKKTAGGTPAAEVNVIHFEARLTWLRRLLLFLRGTSVYDYFNEHLSPSLCSLAKVMP